MLSLLKPQTALGLEKTGSILKKCELSLQRGAVHIHTLETQTADSKEAHVKRLYNSEAIIATALDGNNLLIRTLELPLTKPKDIDAALSFQAEPLLPYPTEEALLAWMKLKQTTEGTQLNLLSVRKDFLQQHLDQWNALKIEPEIISCIQNSLLQFGNFYHRSDSPFLVLHIGEQQTTCILVKEGKLLSSYTQQEGLSILSKAAEEKSLPSLETLDWNSLPASLAENLTRLQMIITRMTYSLAKDLRGENIQGFILTGEAALYSQFAQSLSEKLNIPHLDPQSHLPKDSNEATLRHYAIPIGLAINALQPSPINFRKEEFSYPHPWKRVKAPLLTYFALCSILSLVFYLFGQTYLAHKEANIKENYVNLLAAMGKSHESFETAFLSKHGAAFDKFNGEVVDAIHLDRQDLSQRLDFLQKDLQAIPDSFPLFANIPKVSDVLAWLSSHPLVVRPGEGETEPQARLQIENFSYTMLKRPVQGKKQEKYQVKVEIEFSSSKPKWAREFHDALIAPNDLVDPKGEVKWSSNRGRYRTSFYLKDKTLYPGQ